MNFSVEHIRGTYERPSEAELQTQKRQQMEQLLAVRAKLIRPVRVPDSTALCPIAGNATISAGASDHEYDGRENNAAECFGTVEDFHHQPQRKVA